MKMENSIRTDHDIEIKSIEFDENSPVGIGQTIMKYK